MEIQNKIKRFENLQELKNYLQEEITSDLIQFQLQDETFNYEKDVYVDENQDAEIFLSENNLIKIIDYSQIYYYDYKNNKLRVWDTTLPNSELQEDLITHFKSCFDCSGLYDNDILQVFNKELLCE